LALLNARAGYDPAEDVSVGLYAKAHFHIDDEIKRAIRGKESDAWYHKPVSGDDELFDDEGESDGERWEVIAKAALSDRTVAIIEAAYDDLGRLQPKRLIGPYRADSPIVLSYSRPLEIKSRQHPGNGVFASISLGVIPRTVDCRDRSAPARQTIVRCKS